MGRLSLPPLTTSQDLQIWSCCWCKYSAGWKQKGILQWCNQNFMKLQTSWIFSLNFIIQRLITSDENSEPQKKRLCPSSLKSRSLLAASFRISSFICLKDPTTMCHETKDAEVTPSKLCVWINFFIASTSSHTRIVKTWKWFGLAEVYGKIQNEWISKSNWVSWINEPFYLILMVKNLSTLESN